MKKYRYSLTLQVWHPRMRAEEIAARVGLVPDVANSVAEARVTPKGNKLDGTYGESYCLFSLVDNQEGWLEDGLRDWLDRLSGRATAISEMTIDGGRVRFSAGLYVDEDAGIDIDANCLLSLHRLGSGLSMSIYP